MSTKKIMNSLIFFLVLIGATFYVIFSKNDIYTMLSIITSINYIYIFIALLLVVLYFLMQGIYMKLLLKTLNVKISIFKGMFYSIIEFFFSAITPSSTGGQPVQLYYMSKDKIQTEKSLIVLILNTIIFKLFLVVFGFVILFFKKDIIFENGVYTCVLFWLGMIVDILVIIFCYLAIFNKALVKKIIESFYKIVNKFKKKKVNHKEKTEKILEKYSKNANYINKHKKDIIIGTIITFIQRILMFSITFIVYIGLGLKGISYFELFLLQTFTQITIEGLPLPGGTGALEKVTSDVYLSIFGELTIVGTLLTRTLSFYLPLIIVMMIIIIGTKLCYSNKKINKRSEN